MKKKKLNYAAWKAAQARVAYDKQFKQQAKQYEQRKQQAIKRQQTT